MLLPVRKQPIEDHVEILEKKPLGSRVGRLVAEPYKSRVNLFIALSHLILPLFYLLYYYHIEILLYFLS